MHQYYYKETLGDIASIESMPTAPYGRSNRWLTVILITQEEFGADRQAIQQALEEENIEARPIWKPMHMQPIFRAAAHSSKLMANSRSKKLRGRAPVKYASPQLNSFTIKIFRSITQMESNSCKINR